MHARGVVRLQVAAEVLPVQLEAADYVSAKQQTARQELYKYLCDFLAASIQIGLPSTKVRGLG